MWVCHTFNHNTLWWRLISHFHPPHSFTLINRDFSSNITNENQLNKSNSTSFFLCYTPHTLSVFLTHRSCTRRNIKEKREKEKTSMCMYEKRTMTRRESVCNFSCSILSLSFFLCAIFFINSKRHTQILFSHTLCSMWHIFWSKIRISFSLYW
jgi:hypothetical protein